MLLAVLLTLPSLGAGLALDDYYHKVILSGPRKFRSFVFSDNMFRFLPKDPVHIAKAIDLGSLPWWTYPGVRMEVFHPLSIYTYRLDYWLWPNLPILMHVQNLVWFAGVVLAVGIYYRRMFGQTWMAGAAVLLFAIDDAHATTVGWIANRNSLVAVFFGVSALIFHDLWRRDGRRSGMVLAPLLFAASLFSKEEGLTTCAYLFAYAMFVDSAGRWRGGLALTPYAVLVVVWRVIRTRLDYGVAEMAMYIDPLTDPIRFADALLRRAPIFLLGQWGFPPSDITLIMQRALMKQILWGFAVAFLGLLVVVAFAPLLRKERLARFWLTGMLLSVIPICATYPSDRLLTFVGIGAFGLLAQFWALVFGDSENRPQSLWWRAPAVTLAGIFVVIHLILAPVLLPIRASNPLMLKSLEDSLRKLPLDPNVEEQTVVIVNPPDAFQAGYLLLFRGLDGLPVPGHLRALAGGFPSMTVSRPDETSLVIRPALGFQWFPSDQALRTERRRMPLGYRVELTGMSAEVTALTDDGRPAEVRFRFDSRLEDPSLKWVYFQNGAFKSWTPPAVGDVIELSISR